VPVAADVLRVGGVPQTALTIGIKNLLPDSAPPAPWTCRCRAVLWTNRPGPSAARAAGVSGGPPLVVIGGFVEYLDTPVGSYREVLGAVGVATRHGVRGTVPFMAVDLPASIVGGRANWALPKTFAAFGGTPAGGPLSATGEGWKLTATPRAAGPSVPVRLPGTLVQKWPDGVAREAVIRMSGRMRPALVRVGVEAEPSLSGWLRGGWHPGVVMEMATFVLGAPR